MTDYRRRVLDSAQTIEPTDLGIETTADAEGSAQPEATVDSEGQNTPAASANADGDDPFPPEDPETGEPSLESTAVQIVEAAEIPHAEEISGKQLALSEPSPHYKDWPVDDALLYQLVKTTPLAPNFDVSILLDGSIECYQGLAPRNALQSILAVVFVATSNASLEDFARGATSG